MIVKVCGMREPENTSAVSALGVDMLGFCFRQESPRYVTMISSLAGIMPDYSPERLSSLRSKNSVEGKDMSALPAERPLRVGVFADDMPQNIVTRVYNYDLDFVQLDGSESRIMIENLRRTLEPDIRPGVRIIKSLSIRSVSDFDKCREYEDVVDLFLFAIPGGSADWPLLDHYHGETPFLLGGAVGPEDAEQVNALAHPRFAGVSLDSQFETEPGMKDLESLRCFIDKIRR